MYYKYRKDKAMQTDELKICLVGSSGGHLTHLYMLKPFWSTKSRFWVTFDKEDARSLLKRRKNVSMLLSYKSQYQSSDKKHDNCLESIEKKSDRI